MLRTDDYPSEGRLLLGVLLVLLLVASLAMADLVGDLREGTTVSHVLIEGAIVVAGLIGAAWVARALLRTMRHARQAAADVASLAGQLEVTEAEAARFRTEARDLMAGLARVIDQQFERWRLSPAEKETALLLLKGLSHKEIASVRSVTEATARQQARAIYRKAGLAGRHDLAAFFLEDLMLPSDP